MFLFSFTAFVAVMLLTLLLHETWGRFFDRRARAKKERLQVIQNAVQRAGQSPGGVKTTRQGSALETRLRSRSRMFEQFENLLKRTNSPLSAQRIMALMLALFTAVFVLGLLRHMNPLLLLALAAAIAMTPVLWLLRQARRRRLAFEEKLPETLDYISRALRAGHSLTSAIGMVGKEFSDPVGHEFKIISDEIAFGISFKEALAHLVDRVPGNDINFFVISLAIQHETGGNLTEVLDGLAKTIRQRFKLRGNIRTLSAEGRISAWILVSLPFLFVGIIMLMNPGYISVLWTTPQGQPLLFIGCGLMFAGVLLLKRIVQIKV